MKFKRLLGSRVLVKPDAEPTTTEGGITLPESMKKRLVTGTVVQVGHDCDRHDGKLLLSKADGVLYERPAAAKLEEGGDLVLLNERDIIGVLDK